jgi:hypothetical protein
VHVQVVEDIDAPLVLLEELDYIQRLADPVPGPAGGRRASTRYAINPLWVSGGGA